MNELILFVNFLTLVLVVVLLKVVSPGKTKYKNAVLLDTSALIDGRIIDIAKSGFIPSLLLVPRFVVSELQLLADKSDHDKRERARHGLAVIQELQAMKNVDIAVVNDDVKSTDEVDDKLVELAKRNSALLLTTDFNLLKVAEIEGIRVLNINELAQTLRPTHLPGEQRKLKIVQKGQEKTQGVGYLDDGTMVVVDKAGGKLNKVIDVEFTRTLQTTAGRMMFAKLVESNESPVTPKQEAKKAPRKPRRRSKQTAEDKLLDTIAAQ